MEAVNYEALEVMNCDDFDVVDKSKFSPVEMPKLILENGYVSFNDAAFQALDNVDNVIVLVNQERKEILVAPESALSDRISKREQLMPYQWKRMSEKPENPQVTGPCSFFMRKIMALRGLPWAPSDRVVLPGELTNSYGIQALSFLLVPQAGQK